MPKQVPVKELTSLQESYQVLEEYQRATLNLLEDFDIERSKYQGIQRATLNLLEDFNQERNRFKELQLATMNLLDDFDEERRRYQSIQRATMNLLDDMNEERTRLGRSQAAFMNMLEDFEAERTRAEQSRALLQSVNKELEAFSYSVSHDLRAPLRAISGFSEAVLEDFEPKLDEEGKRYLHLIQDNAHRMGKLIDDLLSFSRLGRQEMTKTEVDMEALVREIFNELASEISRRDIEFRVYPSPIAHGDKTLIRQVLSNLISNALKFTAPREKTLIEFGYKPESDAYYVRDNGVGFDMKYAGKLFGVFQRLHSDTEFEGTGVGLAIVFRIIIRHGGKVWAEAAVDKGATFFFTVPREETKHDR